MKKTGIEIIAMTETEIRKVLEYGISKGYHSTGQFTNEEIDKVLERK